MVFGWLREDNVKGNAPSTENWLQILIRSASKTARGKTWLKTKNTKKRQIQAKDKLGSGFRMGVAVEQIELFSVWGHW